MLKLKYMKYDALPISRKMMKTVMGANMGNMMRQGGLGGMRRRR